MRQCSCAIEDFEEYVGKLNRKIKMSTNFKCNGACMCIHF